MLIDLTPQAFWIIVSNDMHDYIKCVCVCHFYRFTVREKTLYQMVFLRLVSGSGDHLLGN